MPKVLLITADQWRGDCIGRLGHACVKTPNLDRLAAEGGCFTHHFTQCSPCGPARTSLLTGLYLMNHRSVRNGTPLHNRFTNLALQIRSLGIEPALIGYTDTSLDPSNINSADPSLHNDGGVLPGFVQQLPDSTGPVAWVGYLRGLGYPFAAANHPEDEPDVFYPDPNHTEAGDRGPTYAPARYRREHSDSAFSVDHALDYVRRYAGRDWFLHLSLLRPHPPFIAPKPYHDLYSPDDGPALRRHPNAQTEAAIHPYAAYNQELTKRWMQKYNLDLSQERYRRQLRATYWGMITEVDFQLGRLFDGLRELGEYDDTLIVFTSDHGEQLWDHWSLGKQSYYDQTFHIPLIVRLPHISDQHRGVQIDQFTENIDLMPTILDWLGATVPPQCNGRSLLPWLHGDTPSDWRDGVFFEVDFRDVAHGVSEAWFGLEPRACSFAAWRDHRYKYIHFAGLAPLLFCIADDPDELSNLANNPDYAAVMLKYAQKMLSHRMRYADSAYTGMQITRNGLINREQ